MMQVAQIIALEDSRLCDEGSKLMTKLVRQTSGLSHKVDAFVEKRTEIIQIILTG